VSYSAAFGLCSAKYGWRPNTPLTSLSLRWRHTRSNIVNTIGCDTALILIHRCSQGWLVYSRIFVWTVEM
jgi:hypothetical protein